MDKRALLATSEISSGPFETCVHAIRQRVMTTFWAEAQYSCVEALVYTTYIQETEC
jgi:hypothetical protein